MADCNTCPSQNTCAKDETTCMVENNDINHVRNIIGVMSGKGGVGKSSVSVLLAEYLRTQGFSVGIMDADITGPSIPRLVGLETEKASVTDGMMIPVETSDGIKVMSLNFLIEKEEEPVIWRGPLISGLVKQFWAEVLWGDLDFLVIDMPPGTGDVALTVMQSIPLSGVVAVSVPQDFVSMIVSKTVNMARKLNMNVLGIIENMSYITCPDCGRHIQLFDVKKTADFIRTMDLELLGELPMLDGISHLAEYGYTEVYSSLRDIFEPIAAKIIENLEEI